MNNNLFSPKAHTAKELYHVAGDMDRPDKGLLSSVGLNKTATGYPLVLVKNAVGESRILTVDVYQIPGQPMWLQIMCPDCQNNGAPDRMLTIRQEVKQMDYDKGRRSPYAAEFERLGLQDDGTLNVEPFECTWEATPAFEERCNRGILGFSRCNFKVAIENNLAVRV